MDDNMLESLRSFDGVWSRVTGGETPAAGTPEEIANNPQVISAYLGSDDDDDDEGTQMYDTDELDDDLDDDDDEDYAPRKKRGRYADDDEVSEDDEMAERIIHWAPPITAIVCALIIAVSLVYHFVLA